ncbi:MAG: hypothetical protein A2790_10730 [Phenylobacterium sp. RIFCSPHIGHO2_01_FULL_69_31]|uniref:hypothetical protein n=1 Tax=Phenylobacterium sp. RIFCSPHIGHO2_01_FULL_69_31 TaxID=1801944 RepID=UPI0008C8E6C0|nr:hypothetical protein [Phenylobacterium sp. RIFCSPHIGHO2_01_FULL_69_31]OHB31116.1 MAG: hypothetical protein A2790_10730 [Phenylobacterium sp. RIFCSPHIGHO2_01_FULL_69_31]
MLMPEKEVILVKGWAKDNELRETKIAVLMPANVSEDCIDFCLAYDGCGGYQEARFGEAAVGRVIIERQRGTLNMTYRWRVGAGEGGYMKTYSGSCEPLR